MQNDSITEELTITSFNFLKNHFVFLAMKLVSSQIRKFAPQKFTRKYPPERGFKIKIGPNRKNNLFTTESKLVIINKHRAYSGVHFVKRSVVLD